MTVAGEKNQQLFARTLSRSSSTTLVTIAALGCLGLAGCTAGNTVAGVDPKLGVTDSPRIVQGDGPIDPSISRRGAYMVGKPYVVAGRRFVPHEDKRYAATGLASWYGSDFHGHLTANGEVFDSWAISAAHPTMPLPSYARVTNEENGRSLVVRVNDRGPFHAHRLIDVSSRAADLLDMKRVGVGHVKVEYIGRADETDDTTILASSLRTDGTAASLPSSMGTPTLVADAGPIVPTLVNAPASDTTGSIPVLQPGRPVLASIQSAGVIAQPVLRPSIPAVPVLQPGRPLLASMQSSGASVLDPSFDLATIGNAADPVAGTANAGSIPLPPQRDVAFAEGAAARSQVQLKIGDVVGSHAGSSDAQGATALAFASGSSRFQQPTQH